MNKFTHFLFIMFLIFNLSLNTASFRRVVPLEPFFFGEIEAFIANFLNKNIFPTNVSIRYNQDINEKKKIKEKIEIYFNDYVYRTCITLDIKDRAKLLKIIDGYLISINKEKKEKELGQLNANISWKKMEEKWIETFNSKMFIKIVKSIDKKLDMSISFSEGISDSEKHLPGTLYFTEENVNNLKKILSDDNFNGALKNALEIK